MPNATLEEFLNIYWLRPETALWRAIDVAVMSDLAFAPPSLDLGCGDGLFSFVRAGGRLDPAFDAFRSVARLDEFFRKVDVYDHFDAARVRPVVRERPRYTIDVGFDHKEALLRKAGALGLYGELVQGDGNARLPFADASFATIFSNIVYWLDAPAAAFAELARVLRPGGALAVMLPDAAFLDYSFYHRLHVRTGDPRWRWLELVDRGRTSDNVKHARPLAEWQRMFDDAGLRVRTHRRHLSKVVVEAWDIGLRPLFPVLHEMTERLAEADRAEIKRRWIAILLQLAGPLCTAEWPEDPAHPPAFHYFVLERR